MTQRSSSAQLFGLLGWLLVVSVAAALGAFASVEAPQFYAQLSKPSWAPPGWLFGPVWTTLYLLMAVAAWLVWRTPAASKTALVLFVVQLAVNALWSWLFFAWHLGGLATAEILLLWLLLLATLAAFWRISRTAALLMLPYLAWVSFAGLLAWTVWRSNPALL